MFIGMVETDSMTMTMTMMMPTEIANDTEYCKYERWLARGPNREEFKSRKGGVVYNAAHDRWLSGFTCGASLTTDYFWASIYDDRTAPIILVDLDVCHPLFYLNTVITNYFADDAGHFPTKYSDLVIYEWHVDFSMMISDGHHSAVPVKYLDVNMAFPHFMAARVKNLKKEMEIQREINKKKAR
jgi:hypothetical protein